MDSQIAALGVLFGTLFLSAVCSLPHRLGEEEEEDIGEIKVMFIKDIEIPCAATPDAGVRYHVSWNIMEQHDNIKYRTVSNTANVCIK